MGPGTVIRRRPATIIAVFAITLLTVSLWVWKMDTQYWNELYVTKLVKAKLFYNALTECDYSSKRMKNPGLILDTPGCRIPKFDAFDPSIIELYEAKDKWVCDGPPMLLTTRPGGSIVLNETVLKVYYKIKKKDIYCTYEGIRRKYEKPGNVRENDYDLLPPKPLEFGIPIQEDQVRVECSMPKKKPFIHYFPLVRLKEDIEKEKMMIIPHTNPKLNIIVTGVDSISKLNFLRHFKKTHAFLKEKNFFDIKGYTKVGDNTFPNLTPLLTGRHVADIWNETVRDKMYFDDVDMIWKRFGKKGYRTFYAEDSPFYGTFNYERRGFNVTPADYYNRPLYLAMHNSEVRKKGSFYCFNSMLEPYVIYDHLRDFVKTMGPRPYFAFAMESTLTHDNLNYAGYADYPLVELLEDFWDDGTYNNTVIVLFGDHGIRFGNIRKTYLGKFEERMPFMYIYFPHWFLEKYPRIAHNLRQNQERLVTLFDIHATLTQLLDPLHELSPEEYKNSSPYGLSLMGEISPYRTCEKATIFPHWCTCQVMQEVSIDDKEIIKSANLVKDCINNELRDRQSSFCPFLEIDRISNAKLGQLNDMVLRFIDHQNIVIDRSVTYGNKIVNYEDFVITLVTKPEGRVFESTTRHNVVDDTYCVVDIYELNACEHHPSCIDTQKMKTFKYCNS